MITALLKLVFIISSLTFGLSWVVGSEKDDRDQQKSDLRVMKIAGLVTLVSGFWLWIVGW